MFKEVGSWRMGFFVLNAQDNTAHLTLDVMSVL